MDMKPYRIKVVYLYFIVLCPLSSKCWSCRPYHTYRIIFPSHSQIVIQLAPIIPGVHNRTQNSTSWSMIDEQNSCSFLSQCCDVHICIYNNLIVWVSWHTMGSYSCLPLSKFSAHINYVLTVDKKRFGYIFGHDVGLI